MGHHIICPVDEIPAGQSKKITIEGRDIALFNLGDRFAAISNKCPHEGAELCNGRMAAFIDSNEPGVYITHDDRTMVRCPWHGWEFDVKTGKSYCDPKRLRVKSFDVDVSSGADLLDDSEYTETAERVEGPYEIEIYKVSTKNKYVILTI